LYTLVAVGWLKVVGRLVYWAWGVGVGPVAWYGAARPVGRKPVGTSGCIHRYFVLESVVCDVVGLNV
jgi:hypothetical protein